MFLPSKWKVMLSAILAFLCKSAGRPDFGSRLYIPLLEKKKMYQFEVFGGHLSDGWKRRADLDITENRLLRPHHELPWTSSNNSSGGFGKKVMLIAHNCSAFDGSILTAEILKLRKWTVRRIGRGVCGFSDFLQSYATVLRENVRLHKFSSKSEHRTGLRASYITSRTMTLMSQSK